MESLEARPPKADHPRAGRPVPRQATVALVLLYIGPAALLRLHTAQMDLNVCPACGRWSDDFVVAPTRRCWSARHAATARRQGLSDAELGASSVSANASTPPGQCRCEGGRPGSPARSCPGAGQASIPGRVPRRTNSTWAGTAWAISAWISPSPSARQRPESPTTNSPASPATTVTPPGDTTAGSVATPVRSWTTSAASASRPVTSGRLRGRHPAGGAVRPAHRGADRQAGRAQDPPGRATRPAGHHARSDTGPAGAG